MAFDKDEVTLKSLFLRTVRYFHLESEEKIEKGKIFQRESGLQISRMKEQILWYKKPNESHMR